MQAIDISEASSLISKICLLIYTKRDKSRRSEVCVLSSPKETKYSKICSNLFKGASEKDTLWSKCDKSHQRLFIWFKELNILCVIANVIAGNDISKKSQLCLFFPIFTTFIIFVQITHFSQSFDYANLPGLKSICALNYTFLRIISMSKPGAVVLFGVSNFVGDLKRRLWLFPVLKWSAFNSTTVCLNFEACKKECHHCFQYPKYVLENKTSYNLKLSPQHVFLDLLRGTEISWFYLILPRPLMYIIDQRV